MDRPSVEWGQRIEDTGRACLARIGGQVDDADRLGSVLPRSRLLCAGLSALALEVDGALSGAGRDGGEMEEVADLAASLAILTKIDDEVIDAFAFHGGGDSERSIVRRETSRFLRVTERSLLSGHPASSAPRAVFAAAIGRRVQRLSRSQERARELLGLVSQGWATQVDAVVTFSAWPDKVSLRAVDRVTRRVSGDWLAIIAACGALPHERGLSTCEIEAIRDAGEFIQRADALADLEKDQQAGLGATWAGVLTERALSDHASLRERYFISRRSELELLATPSREETQAIGARLAGLGALASAFDWIREMLLDRYRRHPLYRSSVPPLPGPVSSLPLPMIAARTVRPDEAAHTCSAR